MGRVVLILMVKNESKIIERCLKSVEGFVDAFCVTDTGSTDTTCDIVKEFLRTHEGCLSTCEWKDFGHNRTLSVQSAQTYLTKVLNWDLKDTYGLLLDADMVFHPGRLKTHPLGDIGYTIVQKAGNLVYPNCRLIRLDYPWTCKGVTHEYWDGVTKPLGQDICWIEDRNDGGCKSDKFERDARLLEQGLKDDPDNIRYKFYLAQTYHSLGRWRDSIFMYEKRINSGGWYEEVWYSHYMIAQCYLALGDVIQFEAWMLRAFAKNPRRAEPLYKLTKYFREQSQHYKAYHYMKLGMDIPLSTESLFVETDVYTELFHYEKSILEYYVHPETHLGLRASVDYGLRGGGYLQSVLGNLEFYADPVGVVETLTLPRPFGSEYRPSAISLRTYPYANVRYVNYWIENGEYKTPPGTCVHTENAYVNLETGELLKTMNDATVSLPRREVSVKGLEDIRLYGTDRFQATVQEYAPGVRVLDGRYNAETGCYEDCKVLESPHGRSCEKNWLPVGDTGNILYDWHPLQVIGPNAVTHSTPPLFSLFRGSAPPIRRGDEWWALVHLVHYSKPRKYYHCFVVLNSTFKPLRMSLPFVFQSPGIEYCVSMRLLEETAECYVSFQDCNASRVTIAYEDLEWVSVEVS
jgi:glycosyltransferase involved in cell wall biosynthesis